MLGALRHSVGRFPSLLAMSFSSTSHAFSQALPVSTSAARIGQIKRFLDEAHESVFTHKRISTVPIDPNDVFVSNELDMGKIDIIGFDYDYTLASYTDELASALYNMAVDRLVSKYMFPDELRDIPYDPSFAIRGLHYDTSKGLLMKIDAFHKVQSDTVYCGRKPVPKDDVTRFYNGRHIPKEYMEGHMKSLSDLFSLPEACLLANLVEYFSSNSVRFAPAAIFWDVKRVMNELHSDHLIHSEIMSDYDRFLNPNKKLRAFLEEVGKRGKKTFLLTNSPFGFVNSGMSAIVGSDWRDLFDVVIVDAEKPKFFRSDESARYFRQLDISRADRPRLKWSTVTEIKKNNVYANGNSRDLMLLTKWNEMPNSHVLYIGDQIFTDLHEPSLTLGWRTGAIIREVSDEVTQMNRLEYQQQLRWLIDVQRAMKSAQVTSDARASVYHQLSHDELHLNRVFFESLLNDRKETQAKLKGQFNKQFGSVFRTHYNQSYFAHRLSRTADMYMSDVTNLARFSTNHVFLPARTFLPHERSPMRNL